MNAAAARFLRLLWIGAALPALLLAGGCEGLLTFALTGATWTRHTIADEFRGADGVKLGDANGDGLADLVVGWEDSGRVSIHFNPGPILAAGRWPSVTVGRVNDVEDAVFADLDSDGALDVVSACEGGTRTVYVHWAPRNSASVADAGFWQTAALPASVGRQKWMFCEPAQIDGVTGVDLVAGGKDSGAQIGYFAAPADPRDLSAWQWRPLADVRWLMSIIPVDLDADGDVDILYSDRKGDDRGVYWLENRGGGLVWQRHRVGTSTRELMFMDYADIDGDAVAEIVVATDGRELLLFEPTADPRSPWLPSSVTWSESFGTGKAVRAGDLDADGRVDLVFSCENAGGKAGLGWLTQRTIAGVGVWTANDLAGPPGGKFDLIQLLDLDADGDLDLVTTEESADLGVVWYENPPR